MTLSLVPVPPELMTAWIQRSADEYARDLVRVGRSAAQAQHIAEEGMAQSFPAGCPSPGHAVLSVDDDGQAVGYLWIGPATGADDHAWWVWDVLIEEGRRGQGLGRMTMTLAEEYAASHGAHTLGLSVFGFNTRAQRLYESLGYRTTKVTMDKALDRPGPITGM